MLEAINSSYAVGDKAILTEVRLELKPGTITALMGPNGAGKSTLLKIMSGQLTPTTGEVRLYGKPLKAYNAMQLAHLRTMMSQSRGMSFPFLAQEIVMFGRHPHAESGKADLLNIATENMRRTDTQHLARQVYNTLSGGEAARVDLARALAQETEILLLDEPTNHLDPRHQVAVLQLCRDLANEGKAIGVCLHDLNMAANFCDEILLLRNGRTLAYDRAQRVLTSENLRLAYDLDFEIFYPFDGHICIVPSVRPPCAITAELQPT